MSTVIHDRNGQRRLDVYHHEDATYLALRGGARYRVPTADFLAAVAKEHDCIIIPRAELPKVEETGQGDVLIDGHYMDIMNLAARSVALRWLALAEYLAARPPADPVQVAALAAVIESVARTQDLTLVGNRQADAATASIMARRLVERGVTVKAQP